MSSLSSMETGSVMFDAKSDGGIVFWWKCNNSWISNNLRLEEIDDSVSLIRCVRKLGKIRETKAWMAQRVNHTVWK